jgi:hypothetical protein
MVFHRNTLKHATPSKNIKKIMGFTQKCQLRKEKTQNIKSRYCKNKKALLKLQGDIF